MKSTAGNFRGVMRSAGETRAPGGSSRGRGRPAGRTRRDGVLADREALLAAAERVIRVQGPSVSLEEIAAEAGVTKPILYRGVGDKDALVQALAERLDAIMADEIARSVAAATGPRDGFRRLVGAYLEVAAREQALYLYVAAGGASSDRVRKSLLLADGAAARVAEGIASYRTAHDADASVATAWSYALVGALHFVTLWWLRDRAGTIEEITDQIMVMLWSGLGTNDGGTAR
jgi:AcrR family transcriptional regulator